MGEINIAFINHSTVIIDINVKNIMDALQQQVDNDFSPIYNTKAKLSFYEKNAEVPKDFWQLVFLDDSDQAGALGYHELTKSGQPLSKIFARTDQKYGLRVSVTASHELIEMLGDPLAATTVFVQTNAKDPGKFYFFELCDAVEADDLSYLIGNTGVYGSNFVLPSWFETAANLPPYDFRRVLHQPLELAKGGYIGFFDVDTGQFTESTNMVKSMRTVTRILDPGHHSSLRLIPAKDRQCSMI